ncbi:uncharacterized protein EV422DRAFT_525469 [Fimicolochytrium jonesii]|uniref:uncharacterized protein n=1 Tax=Fimicolochytrium jonesii TaxID=1396493 RepID=UPI0022FF3D07|nr:uncharacterized protein EV422DRAFT_525469 [Fimicolochytrium jonesii]KAI8822046.1 hypothetical protein EV422DRAFT_525469 [Fimicolochytrium jonesii]
MSLPRAFVDFLLYRPTQALLLLLLRPSPPPFFQSLTLLALLSYFQNRRLQQAEFEQQLRKLSLASLGEADLPALPQPSSVPALHTNPASQPLRNRLRAAGDDTMAWLTGARGGRVAVRGWGKYNAVVALVGGITIWLFYVSVLLEGVGKDLTGKVDETTPTISVLRFLASPNVFRANIMRPFWLYSSPQESYRSYFVSFFSLFRPHAALRKLFLSSRKHVGPPPPKPPGPPATTTTTTTTTVATSTTHHPQQQQQQQHYPLTQKNTAPQQPSVASPATSSHSSATDRSFDLVGDDPTLFADMDSSAIYDSSQHISHSHSPPYPGSSTHLILSPTRGTSHPSHQQQRAPDSDARSQALRVAALYELEKREWEKEKIKLIRAAEMMYWKGRRDGLEGLLLEPLDGGNAVSFPGK